MDAAFKTKLRPYVIKYQEYIEKLEKDNPYGVPIGLGNWAGSGNIVRFGTTICFANQHFPEIIDASHAFKTTNWLFGCHPPTSERSPPAEGAAFPLTRKEPTPPHPSPSLPTTDPGTG